LRGSYQGAWTLTINRTTHQNMRENMRLNDSAKAFILDPTVSEKSESFSFGNGLMEKTGMPTLFVLKGHGNQHALFIRVKHSEPRVRLTNLVSNQPHNIC
jgi:hypothetical protein